jgi:hypothetical protein
MTASPPGWAEALWTLAHHVAPRCNTGCERTKGKEMRVTVWMVTYNEMGSGPCIQKCVDFLLAQAPMDLGDAIAEVDIYARCQTSEPIIASLKELYDRFQENLKTLPYLQFIRKRRRFDISYASRIVHEGAMFHSNDYALSVSDFRCLVGELAEALGLMRRRLKKSDQFDLDRFESHLRDRVLRADPTSNDCDSG